MKSCLSKYMLLVFCLFFVTFFAHSAFASDSIRESALAGSWYPAYKHQLASMVDGFLEKVAINTNRADRPLRALILPHAGYAYSGQTAAVGFAQIRDQAFRRVVVLAPSHHSPFHGLSIPDVEAYATPLGQVRLDLEAVSQLRTSPLVSSVKQVHEQEHSIEIELPFLQRALQPGWRLVPVLVGHLDEESYPVAANLIRQLLDSETLLVISSDFTHYGPRFGYQPFPLNEQTESKIKQLDNGAIEKIFSKDPEGFLDYIQQSGITICGSRPIALLLHLLPEDARLELLAYQTSGQMLGDFTHSVSYVVIGISSQQPFSAGIDRLMSQQTLGFSEADLRLLHEIALLGIDQVVFGEGMKNQWVTDNLPEGLKKPGGAFVTLRKNGELRGCIGYYQPLFPLHRAVLENGMNAATRDPRFQPVTVEELEGMEVAVSILTAPKPIESIDDFKVGLHGIIMRKDGRQAVYLPEVAKEQGWNSEETLDNLSLKAGFSADAWRNGAKFEVFSSYTYTAPYRQQLRSQ